MLECNPPAVCLLKLAAPTARFLKPSPNRELIEHASCTTAFCLRVAAQVATAPVAATYTGLLAIRCFTAGTIAKLVLRAASRGSTGWALAKVYLPDRSAAAATVAWLTAFTLGQFATSVRQWPSEISGFPHRWPTCCCL